MRKIVLNTMVVLALLSAVPGLSGCKGTGTGSVREAKLADKPLFRDTIYDGAADPILVWNKGEERWFMFYTNRRANMPDDEVNGVDWVHGTPIGIAESTDGGATWRYRCDANIKYGEEGYSFWAPDVAEHEGLYHMYLTVVPGTFADWEHPRNIVHLTSENLIDWNFVSVLPLASDKVIDAGVTRAPDGKWWMYYNNERAGKSIYYAVSDDLYDWEDKGRLQGRWPGGEGPKVFLWKDKYFMIIDHWKGFGVYHSDDMVSWVVQQPERILEEPGTGLDDGFMGNHADVVVDGDKAYIIYFTHPGRAVTNRGYESRRSSVQIAELEYNDGVITCDRDKPVYINLGAR